MTQEYPDSKIVVLRFSDANGFYTTQKRSKLMAKIKAKDTKPEQKLQKALWAAGFRYRKNMKQLPGTPDIVFAKQKLVVFVDGAFWHGHNWAEKKERIKANRGFWLPKIERNMQRDRQNNQMLVEAGWHVIRFWDSDLKKNFDGCVNIISGYLKG